MSILNPYITIKTSSASLSSWSDCIVPLLFDGGHPIQNYFNLLQSSPGGAFNAILYSNIIHQ